jgi:hypothetical protein
VDEAYLICCKVEKLLAIDQSSDVEVVAQKSVIASQFPNNFTGACNYFLAQVSHLHGEAQLESCKHKKCNVLAMYGYGGGDSRSGSSCRHFGGCGRFGGCSGGGHPGGCSECGSSNSTMINGVYFLHPTCAFMEEE